MSSKSHQLDLVDKKLQIHSKTHRMSLTPSTLQNRSKSNYIASSHKTGIITVCKYRKEGFKDNFFNSTLFCVSVKTLWCGNIAYTTQGLETHIFIQKTDFL